ncbi:MAG: hypothetical protein IRY99_20545 [Isosphaeraceae bacterium]|nr:hypothetical protein [Isosphaeraceae bacterium]
MTKAKPTSEISVGKIQQPKTQKPKRIAARDTLPPELVKAILNLMENVWDHNFLNAEENECDPEKDDLHRSFVAVDNWLHGTDTISAVDF